MFRGTCREVVVKVHKRAGTLRETLPEHQSGGKRTKMSISPVASVVFEADNHLPPLCFEWDEATGRMVCEMSDPGKKVNEWCWHLYNFDSEECRGDLLRTCSAHCTEVASTYWDFPLNGPYAYAPYSHRDIGTFFK